MKMLQLCLEQSELSTLHILPPGPRANTVSPRTYHWEPSTTPHFLLLLLCSASPFFLLSPSQTPPTPMHELSTTCSPGETADQEGTEGSLLLFPARLCLFSKHIPICAQVCNVLVLPFPGPQLLQPRISRPSGQRQQRPNTPFARNEIPHSRYSGASLHCSSAVSLASGQRTASYVWSEQSVSDCEYGTN
jgi:hypothetical protein